MYHHPFFTFDPCFTGASSLGQGITIYFAAVIPSDPNPLFAAFPSSLFITDSSRRLQSNIYCWCRYLVKLVTSNRFPNQLLASELLHVFLKAVITQSKRRATQFSLLDQFDVKKNVSTIMKLSIFTSLRSTVITDSDSFHEYVSVCRCTVIYRMLLFVVW